MNRLFFIPIAIFIAFLSIGFVGGIAFADTPALVWNHTYCSGSDDDIYGATSSSDGGFCLVGHTKPASGNMESWLIKTNANGTVSWTRTYGSYDDVEWNSAYSIIQTNDNGYALVGEIDNSSNGYGDVRVIKTDSLGNLLWDTTYGYETDSYDFGRDIIQTSDGEYVIVGENDNSSNGWGDIWVIKIDEAGNVIWSKTYDYATSFDSSCAVIETTDGYLISGYTYANSNKDLWVIKIDLTGNMVWNKTYGQSASSDGPGYSITRTSDGGYIIPGTTGPNTWLIKIDASGNEVFNRTYGPGRGYYSTQTPDGGYEFTGTWYGSGVGDVLQVVKTDSMGYKLWNYTYIPVRGESSIGYFIMPASDNTTVVCGNYYNSSYVNSGLLIKIATPTIPYLPVKLYGPDTGYNVISTSDGGYLIAGEYSTLLKTDHCGNVEWQKKYNSSDGSYVGFYSVARDNDSYVAAGYYFYYDYAVYACVIKTDLNGNVTWQKEYPNHEGVNSIAVTGDGYIITGRTLIPSSGTVRSSVYAVYLTKIDLNGNIVWDKTFVGPNRDYWGNAQEGAHVLALNDDFLITGSTSDYSSHSWVYVIKTDVNGNLIWQNTYGGTGVYTSGYQAHLASDGYVILGRTNSFSSVSGVSGIDFYLLKIDFNGNLIWQKTYGEANYCDTGYSIASVGDGYLLTGYTDYGPRRVLPVIKTDLNGNVLWNKTYEGPGSRYGITGYSIIADNSSGFVITGSYYQEGIGYSQIFLLNPMGFATNLPDLSISSSDITFEKVI